MKTYTTHYESWLCQLYYYLITSVPLGEEFQSYHDLPKDDWWEAVMRRGIADDVKAIRDLAEERVALVKSIHK